MVTITDVRTGQTFIVDRAKGRIARMRRRVFAWAACANEIMTDLPGAYMAMVTLTYRDVGGWEANHIRSFMLWVKDYLGDGLVAYAWTAELQKRGAMHYHVLLVMLHGERIPMPDKSGAWVHGVTRVEKARTPYYICKYTTKGNDGDGNRYPRQARVFGCYIGNHYRDVPSWQNYKCSSYPHWLAEVLANSAHSGNARREPGGGWRIGEYVFASPYTARVERG